MVHMSKISNQPPPRLTKNLLLTWRPGQVLTTRGLLALGISRARASALKKDGTLAALGDGAYRKSIETPTWPAAIEALQRQLMIRLHIGGRTALELQGTSQYGRPGTQAPVWLFLDGKVNPPKWFRAHDWSATIHIQRRNLFLGGADHLRAAEVDGFSVAISRRERAILEAIELVGKYHRFGELMELFDGLTSLDPQVLQDLLERCTSIKVKRVFLFLARASGHAWFAKLDELKIDLGSGKREIVPGGRLDARYLITVPPNAEEPDV